MQNNHGVKYTLHVYKYLKISVHKGFQGVHVIESSNLVFDIGTM